MLAGIAEARTLYYYAPSPAGRILPAGRHEDLVYDAQSDTWSRAPRRRADVLPEVPGRAAAEPEETPSGTGEILRYDRYGKAKSLYLGSYPERKGLLIDLKA